MLKYILISVFLVLSISGDVAAQRFSKDFFTIRFLDNSVTFIASIDYTTKRHFARDFLLSNVLSFAKVGSRTNRIIMYSAIIGFEFGQGRVDILDILAGAIGIELNLAIRRLFSKRKG